MPRFFNTAGPSDPGRHYTLPILARLPRVRRLLDQQHYAVLHAPRQSGKTTTLLHLARELTATGSHVAALLSLDHGAPRSSDLGATELSLLDAWSRATAISLPPDLQPPPWSNVTSAPSAPSAPSASEAPAGSRISAALRAWAEAAPRPLVLFLDDMDALRDDVLLPILRQLRAGYPTRPAHFPHALLLSGLRDVRDARDVRGIVSSDGRPGAAHPFSIKAESITLRDFTREEVAALYAQHTAETGQAFLPEAIDRAFHLTQGQPWLVNALARQLTEELCPDPAKPITRAHVEEAKEILLLRRDPHLDSLMSKLEEPRVRVILEPMLAGSMLGSVAEDDVRHALDLGLVRMDPEGGLTVANPIYRESIVRALTFTRRASLPHLPATWLTPEGRLDKEALLHAFLDFWRQHGDPLLAAAPYPDVAPHLVLMAFLHRVVNGASLDREYAMGRGRMGLCVRAHDETLAIEIKVWRPDQKTDPLPEGLQQLDTYLASLGLDTGWLVLFDRRPSAPPLAERLSAAPLTTPGGRRITVIRT
ncbi:AAA family ATPase [Chondromyces apiculatus]|uniref:Orc1-like AAA ATPase domain-containing protein n=1 Tax=Chondromyces apiculatus DSM 436 TaxID=1192034 RepID=A0A017SY16_9BACT|nr:AAA family ATPase [Chondromyces apiculatus]EYF01647.1 Hypothetical protein CAP_7966 [Chondromyces apiculatus DSM 436]